MATTSISTLLTHTKDKGMLLTHTKDKEEVGVVERRCWIRRSGGGWGGGLSFPPPPIAHVDNSAVPSQSNPEEEEEEDSKPAAVQNNDKPPKQAQVDPFMPIPLSRSASKQEREVPQAQAKDSEIPDQNQKAE